MALTKLSYEGQGTELVGVVSSGAIGTVAAASTQDLSIAVPEALLGDVVRVSGPAAGLAAGLGIVDAFCSANGTVKVRIMNCTAAGVAGGTVNLNIQLSRS